VPSEVVIKLNAAAVAALALREKFAQLGLDTIVGSPKELAVIIKSDIVKWAKVIDDAGIKAEE
jgi:tripartite-type tricarboxylate transporter receptor subunit TctC